MRKLLNFRMMLILALSLLVASLTATYFLYSKTLMIVTICLLILTFAILIGFSIFTKRKIFYVFASIVLVLVLPFLNLFCKIDKYDSIYKFNNTESMVYGRISENYQITSGTNVKLMLDDVRLSNKDNNKHIGGNFVIYINSANIDRSNFKVGRYISLSAKIHIYEFDGKNEKALSNLSRNVVGYGSSTFKYIEFTDKFNYELRDRVKQSTFDLMNAVDVPYLDIGFTMLFGDKTYIDQDVNSIFRTTGIAHLLAVSGLHVSIIVMVICYILKKLKSSNLVQFIAVSIFVVFYMYICNFSVSVVRAGLMAMFILYAKVRGKAYDNLSILSLVLCILLLINPLYIFNVSFVLSFSSVLAIILLIAPFERFFKKFLKPKFASSLALNCSVQVGLTITSAYYFGKVSLLSFLCNLISVPIAVVAFVLYILMIFVVAILPFMKFVLYIYGYLMSLVVKFNYLVSQIDLTLFFTEFSIIYDIILKFLIFVVSDYCFASKQTKRVAVLVIVATFMQVCLLY